jgi:membrane-bound metal-dependent hydrolase YbcI (DUF457 family)
MNIVNHIIIAFAAMLLVFPSHPPLVLLWFAFVFGGLVDLDGVILSLLHRKKVTSWRKAEKYWRTFVQEPLGFVLIGFPLAILAEYLRPGSFLLVIFPYASHIIIDYISMHDVQPLAPFSKKKCRVGYIRCWAKPNWHAEKRGVPETAIAVSAVGILIALLL